MYGHKCLFHILFARSISLWYKTGMPHTRSFNFKNQIQQDEKNLNSILARQVADAIGILIKKGLIEYLFVSDKFFRQSYLSTLL